MKILRYKRRKIILSKFLLNFFIVSLLFSGVGLNIFKASGVAFLKWPNIFLLLLIIDSLFLIFNKKKNLKLSIIHFLVFLFLILMFFNYYGAADKKSFFIDFLAVSRGIIFIFISVVLVQNFSEIKSLINTFLFTGVMGAISGLFQEIYFLLKNVAILGSSTYYTTVNLNGITFLRVTSFFSDPNVFATFLLIPIGIFLTELKFKEKTSAKFYICGFLLVSSFFFTFSRGGFLGLLLFSIIALIRFAFNNGKISKGYVPKKIFYIIPVFIIIILICFFVISLRSVGDVSINMRILAIIESIKTTFQHPLLGIGLGNIKNYSSLSQTSHNLFLEISTTLGLIGLFLFFIILYFVFKYLKIIQYKETEVGKILENCLILFLFSSLFLSMLTNVLLWILIGLINVAYLKLPKSYV